MTTEEEIDQAIGRLAFTSDGMLLYLRLQRVLMGLSPFTADSGALHRYEGRRTFAQELKVLMDRKLAEQPSGSRTDAERAIVIQPRQPVIDARPRGTDRRVPAHPGSGNTGSGRGTN